MPRIPSAAVRPPARDPLSPTHVAPPARHHRARRRLGLAAAAIAPVVLTGCLATTPTLGTNKGVVTGAAGGAAAEAQNTSLERCDQSLGTLAISEDQSAPWYVALRDRQLGSTVPMLRLMIQQSNCFVIVDRGPALRAMQQERQLAQSGEMRAGSQLGPGQMVAADYTMSPSIMFSGRTGGGGAGLIGGGLVGAALGLAGSVGRNEASTTLLLVDNRSGVQISAAEGTARNFDFGVLGAAFGGLGAAGAGGWSSTPQGKVITAAFADSFNQMVKALRNYQAQTVKGGLGTGGRLGVDGGVNSPAAAPAPAAPARQPSR